MSTEENRELVRVAGNSEFDNSSEHKTRQQYIEPSCTQIAVL